MLSLRKKLIYHILKLPKYQIRNRSIFVKLYVSATLTILAFFILSCDYNNSTPAGSYPLRENEVRGKVIFVDSNNSMVRVEVLGCGNDLRKEWQEYQGFEKSFALQPGDLNLLREGRRFSFFLFAPMTSLIYEFPSRTFS